MTETPQDDENAGRRNSHWSPLPSAGSGTVSLTLPLPTAPDDDDENPQFDWV